MSAKGGGKTFLLCLWAFYWADYLIDFFGLMDTKNPLPLGYIGRRQSVDMSHTTLETWKKIIPADMYHIREMEKEIVIRGLGKIWFGGLDRSESVNKFNSAELAFYAIDQAEETNRKDIAVLEGSLRLVHKGKKPPYKILYTANPAECWLKKSYVDKILDGKHYVPALYTDNKFLPSDYGDRLEKAFEYDSALLKAYKEGDWDVISQDRIMIPRKYINKCEGLMILHTEEKMIISCDVATGGDECVIYVIRETHVVGDKSGIIDQMILHYDDTMKIVGELMMLSAKWDCNNYAIDVIGVGKGVCDRLVELGKNVQPIQSAESPINKERFENRRAEMWWHIRERFIDREIKFPEDDLLQEQLSSPRFDIVNSNGKIKLEPKLKTKERLGSSPDRADAFVYGYWGLQFIEEPKDERVFANLPNGVRGKVSRYGWGAK